MRNLLLATSASLLASACTSGPTVLPDPPVLHVTSPSRSLIQDHAGAVTVAGTVAPGDKGVAVTKVSVNGVDAVVGADGSFSAIVNVPAGATLLHTEAVDAAGGKATDTRSVEAGELRAPGAEVENAITAALSTQAFAKLASAAGPLIKQTDMAALLAPMQPMMHSGDANGEDCLFARLYVDNLTMSDAKIQLVPVDGGLAFSAELDGLDVPGHMRYAAACVSGSNTTDISASKVVIAGTLLISPNGMMGFDTQLVDQNVSLEGLHISASGIPGAILDILPLDSVIQYVAPKAAEMFMGPMMNKALGALGGPQKLNVLGKTIDVQVAPTDITFTSSGGLVTLNTKMLIEGTEGSKGFIYTDNGMPNMDPGQGMQLGLADDLANEMLSQLVATGLLSLSMPTPGGSFDTTTVAMTSPPMISADPADGKMRLYLPDMMATFTLAGVPMAQAAMNAKVDLKIVPANGNDFAIAIQLGTPTIDVDVVDDVVANQSRLTNADLATGVKLSLDAQIRTVSALLGTIPMPQMAGLQMKDLSVTADSGYVMVKGELQ
jgi:Glucodextranase, domain B